MEITIKDNTYKVKYSIRALFIFEEMTGKPFKLEKVMDFYIFFYSMILANNPDSNLLFNDFVDACDEDASLFTSFQNYLNEVFSKENQFKTEDSNSKKK